MSTITLTPDTVEVSFSTVEKVTGLLGDQSIPRAAITGVEVVPSGLEAAKGIRAPGLGLPFLRKLGTWRRRSGKELVDVRRGQPALRLTLTGHRYQAVVLGTPDAAKLAEQLRVR